MKKNKKLLKTVATSAFACLCTAALATGIIAATQHNVNISTSVSFSAQGVSGTLTGALKGHTNGSSTIVDATQANTILTANATDADFEYNFNNSSTASGWTTGELSIATNSEGLASTLIMEFTIENKGTNDIGFSLSFSDTTSTNLSVSFEYDVATTGTNVDWVDTEQNNPYVKIEDGQTGVFRIIYDVVNPSLSTTTLTPIMQINLAPYDNTKYGVTYFANGSAGTAKTSVITTATTLAHETNPFTAPTGKIFQGWYETIACTGTEVANLNSISTNKVLYAKWEVDPLAVLQSAIDTKLGANVATVKQYTNYTATPTGSETTAIAPDATFNGYYYIEFTGYTTYNSQDVRWIIIGENSTLYCGAVENTSTRATNLSTNQLLLLSEKTLLSDAWQDAYTSNNWSSSDFVTGNVLSGLATSLGVSSYMAEVALTTFSYSANGHSAQSGYTYSGYNEIQNTASSQLFLLATKNGYNNELQGATYKSSADAQNFCIEDYLTSNSQRKTTGASSYFWLRSGDSGANYGAYGVGGDGYVYAPDVNSVYGARPAFVLEI